MVKRPTVFVLGAGGSAPYGFPLGGELMQGIQYELLRGATAFRNDLLTAEFHELALQQFALALKASGLYSIDEFLQWHPEHRRLGKLAIARMLIPAERHDRLDFGADYKLWLPAGSPDTRWYRYFFNQLLRSRKGRCDLAGNLVTIVTFNFDRSFERALYLFMQANCGADAIAQVRQIPIYHVHGQLGLPDWISTSTRLSGHRDYDPRDPGSIPQPSISKAELRLCADQIRIVDEEVTDSPILRSALGALEDAEVVAFLGFSYHPLNLQKLRLEKLQGKDIRGTAYQLPLGPRGAVQKAFDAAGTKIMLAEPSDHVLTFLENTDLIFD